MGVHEGPGDRPKLYPPALLERRDQMPNLLNVGDCVINLDRVAWVKLHADDPDPEDPDAEESGTVLEIGFGEERLTVFGARAAALRWYFTAHAATLTPPGPGPESSVVSEQSSVQTRIKPD